MKLLDTGERRRWRRLARGVRPPVRAWTSRPFDDAEDEWLETACLGAERDADGN